MTYIQQSLVAFKTQVEMESFAVVIADGNLDGSRNVSRRGMFVWLTKSLNGGSISMGLALGSWWAGQLVFGSWSWYWLATVPQSKLFECSSEIIYTLKIWSITTPFKFNSWCGIMWLIYCDHSKRRIIKFVNSLVETVYYRLSRACQNDVNSYPYCRR